MTITKSVQQQINLGINGKLRGKVSKYKYLETTTVNEGDEYTEKIKLRIGQARTIFNSILAYNLEPLLDEMQSCGLKKNIDWKRLRYHIGGS